MARPKGSADSDSRPPTGDEAEPVEVPDPLAGWKWDDSKPGPDSSLRPEMVPVLCKAIASGATKREAAADAGTTEDCLDGWLKRGRDAASRKKRNPYTRLLVAYERAEAHYQRWARAQLHRTVFDRKANPRPLTWMLATRDPKHHTVPREATATQVGQGLGPAFELVTPEQAAASLEEKARKFLELEDRREALFSEAPASAPDAASPAPPEAGAPGGG